MQAQFLWCSIGWATAATLGAAIVARQQGRRTMLFTGDGSMWAWLARRASQAKAEQALCRSQLTVQEISTMIRQGWKPIIV